MLARNAESLYWIGRYVERADDTARILDVTDTGSGGLVVAEWVRGGSLQEVAETSPSPMGGARAVRSLAAAIDTAPVRPLTCTGV